MTAARWLLTAIGCCALYVTLDVWIHVSTAHVADSTLDPLNWIASVCLFAMFFEWLRRPVKVWWRYERRRNGGTAKLRRAILCIIGFVIMMGAAMACSSWFSAPR